MTYGEWFGYFLGQGHSPVSAQALAADAVVNDLPMPPSSPRNDIDGP